MSASDSAAKQPRCHRCGGRLPLEGEDYDVRVTDYCCTECAKKVIDAAPVQEPSFVVTTTYEVWMRLDGQTWRPWSGNHVEEHHAQEEADRLATHGVRAGLMPRKIRLIRRTVTLDWIGDERVLD